MPNDVSDKCGIGAAPNVTRNLKDFSHPDLTVLDPWSA